MLGNLFGNHNQDDQPVEQPQQGQIPPQSTPALNSPAPTMPHPQQPLPTNNTLQ